MKSKTGLECSVCGDCDYVIDVTMPHGGIGLWDFPTVSSVQQSSCSAAQGYLTRPVHKAWLQQQFSLMLSKPSNSSTVQYKGTETDRNVMRHETFILGSVKGKET